MEKFSIFVALLLTISMAVESSFGYVVAVILLIVGIILSIKRKK